MSCCFLLCCISFLLLCCLFVCLDFSCHNHNDYSRTTSGNQAYPLQTHASGSFRSLQEGRVHPSHGFVDGGLVESFLDFDGGTMEAGTAMVVDEMNRDGGWEMESHSKNKIDDDDGDMPVDNSRA